MADKSFAQKSLIEVAAPLVTAALNYKGPGIAKTPPSGGNLVSTPSWANNLYPSDKINTSPGYGSYIPTAKTATNPVFPPSNAELSPPVSNDYSTLNASVASATQRIQDIQKQLDDITNKVPVNDIGQSDSQILSETYQNEYGVGPGEGAVIASGDKQYTMRNGQWIKTGQTSTNVSFPGFNVATNGGITGGIKDLAANIFGFSQPTTSSKSSTDYINDILNVKNQVYSAFGITPETLQKANDLTTQINTYALDMNNLDNLEMQALNQNEKQYAGRLSDIKRGEDAYIQRDFNFKRADLAYRSGLLEIQRQGLLGNQKAADALIPTVINYATTQERQKVQDMQWTMEFYKDVYDSLDKKDQQEFENQLNLAKFDLDKKNSELDAYFKQQSLNSSGAGSYTPGSNPTVDNWARLIIAGQSKITDVPNPKGSTLRSQVVDAINNSGQLLLSDKDREKLSTLDTAFNVYNTIKGLSDKINTFGPGGRITGAVGRYLGGATQLNTDIARYNAARQGFVSNVARTLGEKGALAEGDVQRAISNLPTVNDTQEVAQGKLETLKSILESSKNSIIQKSTSPIGGLTSGTLENTSGMTDEQAYQEYLKMFK